MRKKCNYNFRKIYLLLVYVYLAAACPVLAQFVPPQQEEGRGKPPLYQEMGKEKWISTIVPQLVNPPVAPAEGWLPAGGVSGFGNGQWEDLNINSEKKLNGRIRAVMLDPTRPMQRIWAGGESSTLMYMDKSVRGWSELAEWQIVSDKWPCSNISCITYNPDVINEFYVGTGNNFGGFFPGCGIFKSTDAGETWNVIQSTLRPEFAVVREIICLNTRTTLVLTGDSGIYISRDNQTTWSRLQTTIYGKVSETKFNDIANYPGIGLFFAVSSKKAEIKATRIVRYPNFLAGGTALTLYDTAHSFENLVFSENALAGDPVYVAMNTNGSNYVDKLMKFNATTVALEHRNPPPILINPNSAFFVMAAVGPEFLCIGGTNFSYTIDATSSWNYGQLLTTGGDQNDVSLLSHNGESYLATSCDFGAQINRIIPGPVSRLDLSDLNNRILQVYSVARHPDRGIYYIGTQDLAAFCNTSCEFTAQGDIRKVHIDYDNRALFSQSHEYAKCQRLGSTEVITFARSHIGGWGTLNAFDDVHNRLFCHPGQVGDSLRWYQMFYNSAALRYDYYAVKTNLPISGDEKIAAIYALEDGLHLLMGTNGGNLFRYNYFTPTNQHINIRSLEFGNLPVRLIKQNDTKTKLYVTLSDNTESKIMVSPDQGITWRNLTGNLPPIPVYALVESRSSSDQLFAGTDYGVWYTLNAGSKYPLWYKDQSMPNFRITELDYSPDKKKIIASSYGRGIWEYSFCQDDTAATGQQLFFERLTKKDTLQLTFGRHWFQSSSANKWNVVFTANPFPGAGGNGALATLPAPATGKNIGEIYSRNIDSTEAGGAKVTIVFSQGAISNVRNLNMLQVDVSVDCGTTWLNIWSLKADQLVTIRNVLAQNTPESQAAFKKVVIPVPDKICRNNKYRVRIRGEVFAGNAPLFLQSVQFDR